MNVRFMAIACLCLASAFSAGAQQEQSVIPQFQKSYSIELGTGIQPFYMNSWTAPSDAVKDRLAAKGQRPAWPYYYPVISLTGVMRVSRKSEHILTLGSTWCHHQVMQYAESGGVDPEGKPRYNTKESTIIGWMDSSAMFSLTWQWRHLWTPDRPVVLYSGLGIGLVMLTPVPDLTPFGLRFGGTHLYGFAELTLGPVATLAHGGLGWRF